jgi:hypothetical protein
LAFIVRMSEGRQKAKRPKCENHLCQQVGEEVSSDVLNNQVLDRR